MRRIVLKTTNPAHWRELLEMLFAVFPECEVEVVCEKGDDVWERIQENLSQWQGRGFH